MWCLTGLENGTQVVKRTGVVVADRGESIAVSVGESGFSGVEWTGMVEWNGIKLDTSDWFHLRIDHVLIKATQIK